MMIDKELMVPVIQLMGYKKGNTDDIWKRQGEDCIYGVDFAKGEVFKFMDGVRILEDPDDEILNDTIQAVESGMSVLRTGNTMSQNKSIHNNMQDRRGIQDKGQQTSSQEA
ncbi:MAG: hypothetical protein JXA38_00645, partial [Methanosarcinaceae archaeon]|nr:hypothetical protein [Methanosarcinaceae archaeon]